jgi:hypothetical protein
MCTCMQSGTHSLDGGFFCTHSACVLAVPCSPASGLLVFWCFWLLSGQYARIPSSLLAVFAFRSLSIVTAACNLRLEVKVHCVDGNSVRIAHAIQTEFPIAWAIQTESPIAWGIQTEFPIAWAIQTEFPIAWAIALQPSSTASSGPEFKKWVSQEFLCRKLTSVAERRQPCLEKLPSGKHTRKLHKAALRYLHSFVAKSDI